MYALARRLFHLQRVNKCFPMTSPSFAMSSSTYYTPVEDEFVDDSEPERARQRAFRQGEPFLELDLSDAEGFVPSSGSVASWLGSAVDSDTAAAELIEDSEPERIRQRALEPAVVLEISSDEEAVNIATPKPSVQRYESISPVGKGQPLARVSRPDSLTAKKNLVFSQFAYQSAEAGPSRRHLSVAAAPVPETIVAPKRAKISKAAHRFTEDFTNTELALVRKCIGCDVIWTVRKTVPQKMLHIQSCSKKRSFTDDTIRALLRKEINANVLTVSPKRQLASKLSETSQTYLENVVADAGPRKRQSKTLHHQTVKEPVAANADIRQKAAEMLGTSLRCDDTERENRPPMTQPFGRSALAQDHSNPTILFYTSDADEDEETEIGAPPATQAFAPSRLGGATITTRSGPSLFSLGAEDDSDEELPLKGSQPVTSSLKVRSPNLFPKLALILCRS